MTTLEDQAIETEEKKDSINPEKRGEAEAEIRLWEHDDSEEWGYGIYVMDPHFGDGWKQAESPDFRGKILNNCILLYDRRKDNGMPDPFRAAPNADEPKVMKEMWGVLERRAINYTREFAKRTKVYFSGEVTKTD
tara:strand:+ start:3310 stop:3714 length:405 start_codon:yes stop_codon:yes gene_type:complete